MQQLPAAAAAATQAQLLSPTGQLQAVHQPPAAAVQTQQALDEHGRSLEHLLATGPGRAAPADQRLVL